MKAMKRCWSRKHSIWRALILSLALYSVAAGSHLNPQGIAVSVVSRAVTLAAEDGSPAASLPISGPDKQPVYAEPGIDHPGIQPLGIGLLTQPGGADESARGVSGQPQRSHRTAESNERVLPRNQPPKDGGKVRPPKPPHHPTSCNPTSRRRLYTDRLVQRDQIKIKRVGPWGT